MVLLPQPLAPTRATVDPVCTPRQIESSTVTPGRLAYTNSMSWMRISPLNKGWNEKVTHIRIHEIITILIALVIFITSYRKQPRQCMGGGGRGVYFTKFAVAGFCMRHKMDQIRSKVLLRWGSKRSKINEKGSQLVWKLRRKLRSKVIQNVYKLLNNTF